jgi:hypothetical protein
VDPKVVGREAVVHDEAEAEATPLERFDHLAGLGEVEREWLFAEDVLPCLCRRDRGLMMQIVRQADRDHVDVGA